MWVLKPEAECVLHRSNGSSRERNPRTQSLSNPCPCLRHQTSLSLQGRAAGQRGMDLASQSTGITRCSEGSLERKTEVLRPLLCSPSIPVALGRCQPASLRAARSQGLAEKSSEQNIYRKRVSIHHSKLPAYSDLSKQCKSCLKSSAVAKLGWRQSTGGAARP